MKYYKGLKIGKNDLYRKIDFFEVDYKMEGWSYSFFWISVENWFKKRSSVHLKGKHSSTMDIESGECQIGSGLSYKPI